MPSTYTLNNGIELIATGEQSGTWGDTTNTNLSLIDTALDGQVTVTLASAGTSGSPNTLAISDGSASDGRNRMVIFADGGDLGATAYVQLTPNDAEKIVYIRNDLSGSRSVILFQGTYNASNDYEVPAGTTAVIYFDGTGAGAVAANVFNNAYFDSLRLGSVSVTAILDEDDMASDSDTALATQQSIKAYVDSQVGTVDTLSEILANGNTTGGTNISVNGTDNIVFGDNNKALFGAGSDLEIYHDGSNSVIKDNGAGDLRIMGSDDVRIVDAVNEENMARFNRDGAVTLYYDNAEKLATTATGIDVTGTVVSDGLTVGDSHTIGNDASDNLEIKSSTGENLLLKTGGSVIQLYNSSDVRYFRMDDNGDISFYEDTGTTAKFFWDASAERLYIGDNTVSASAAANNFVIGDTGSTGMSFISGDSDAQSIMFGDATDEASGRIQYFHNDDHMEFSVNGGSEAMRIDSSGNLLVGKTSQGSSTVGGEILASGTIIGTRSGSTAGRFNRTTSDGEIVDFRKDNTIVGSIGYESAGTYIDGEASHSGIRFGQGAVTPRLNGSSDDGNINLGNSTERWENLYLSGTITNDGTGGISIDTSGNVGIGTSSPSDELQITGADPAIRLDDTTAGGYARLFANNGSLLLQADEGNSVSNSIISFDVDGSERMRIDSSGNLLVGKTSTNYADDGLTVFSNGATQITRSGSVGLFVNRTTSDGEMVRFSKDGSTVGSIGYESAGTYIDGETNHSGLSFQAPNITPRYNGSITDDTVHLGSTSNRFKDLFLSGGVYLGGTGSANYLDDYEEGTWTPTTEAGLDSISVGSATYTKIGRVVFIHLNATLNGDATASQVRIGGLPFTPQSGTSGRGDATPWIDFCALGADDYIPKAAIYSSETWIRHFRVRTNSKANQGNIEGNMLDSASEYNVNISYVLA